MKKRNKRLQSIIQLFLFIGILLLLNILANARWGNQALYGFIDLTEEKRFTLTEGTKNLLQELDDIVTIEILLDGELPANYKRLKEAVRQTLDDFRSESGFIEYRFSDPMAGNNESDLKVQEELAKQGIFPMQQRTQNADELSLKFIYPYARFYYKGRPAAVNFLSNQVPNMPEEVVLENSIGLLEYQFANIIQKLQSAKRKNIVFTAGHGELVPLQTADLERSLRAFYNTDRIILDSVINISNEIDALIVAKPRFAFSDKDKFKIDQYVMNGGKVLWLLDAMRVDMDSLQGNNEYLAIDYQLDLNNLLFNYGIRIQPNLLMDLSCTTIPLRVGQMGSASQFEDFQYPYHPVISPISRHPVVKGINPVNLLFASSMDTTSRTKTPIKRTPLLVSSEYSRLQFNPVRMNFDFLELGLKQAQFNKGPQIVAMALEGSFASLYENRVMDDMLATFKSIGLEFKTRSPNTRMIAVADGDIARNRVLLQEGQPIPQPLGYNDYVKFQFANKDFLINAIEYLMDTNGVIEARAKEVKLRLLNESKAKEEKRYWQILNILVPVLFILLFGLAYNFIRKRRFGK